MKISMLGAFLLALGLSLSSCGSVETAFDCNDVCNRYKDCYNPSYDVTTCRNNCRSAAASDPNKQADAMACDSCIGDKSCLSATFNCASECSGIVP
jgi:hypothetical protein